MVMYQHVDGDLVLHLRLKLYRQVHRIAPNLQTAYSGRISRQGDEVLFTDPGGYAATRLRVDRCINVRGCDVEELVRRAMAEIGPAVAFMSGTKRFALQVLEMFKADDPRIFGQQYAAVIVWGVS